MPLTYQALGAALEVTGSKHLFGVNGDRILIDCGMFQGRRAETQEKNQELGFEPQTLAAAILSHGHFDHCGNLPSLTRKGYTGNIYSTPATRDIANLIMMDCAHIMAKDYEWMRRKQPAKHAYTPIYDASDVVDVLDHFVTLNYHRRFPVADGVTCEFHNAGHILGSSMVQLTFRDGSTPRSVCFTGDLGRYGMPIVANPDPIPSVDYLFCEGTYGNRLHDPMDQAQHELAQAIGETVKRGGKVIIPSFAIGRTQQLIYFLHLLKDANKIPDIDIFVDSPMAVNATGIFRVHQECYNDDVHKAFLDHHQNPFGFAGLHYVTELNDSKALNDRSYPCIIISSSGMCEAGRILHHLKNNITDPRNTILVVGYMAENTLGRAIADRKPVVKIFGDEYPLRARVKILNTLSAHADYEDITAYVGAMDLDRLKCVYLVHGEQDALKNLKDVLMSTTKVRAVEIAEPGRTYKLE